MSQSIYNKNRQQLENLMQQVGISQIKELSRLSGVSQWQLTRLEYGLILKMPVEALLKLSSILKISLNDLLNLFSSDEVISASLSPKIVDNTEELEALKQEMAQQLQTHRVEFQRLQQQMEQQEETLTQQFQAASIQTLESWLVQWPTAAVSAQKNPKLPATKLLPLLKPMATLLKQWGVEAIASVGELVPYDPQFHELMEGQAQPGERVKVRYVGYRQGDKLLYRAKVSPLESAPTDSTATKTNEPTTALDVPQSSGTTILDVADDAPSTILDVSEDEAVDEETAKNILS